MPLAALALSFKPPHSMRMGNRLGTDRLKMYEMLLPLA